MFCRVQWVHVAGRVKLAVQVLKCLLEIQVVLDLPVNQETQ